MSGYNTPRPVRGGDDVTTFDSGDISLDGYLRTRAAGQRQGREHRTVTEIDDSAETFE